MEPTTGLEPVTSSLPRKCSTAELCGPLYKMERVMGIEPTSSAWKAEVLPLNYTRNLANNSRLAVSGRTQSIQFRRRTLMKHSKMNLSTSGRGSSTLNDRKKKPPTLDLAQMPNSFAILYLYLYWVFALLPAPRRKNNTIKQLSYFPTKFRRNWWRG
jgi:hypothetical protein